MSGMNNYCRFCGAALKHTFVDLGRSPLANSFLSAQDIGRGEVSYPLHVFVCEHCLLVQLQEFERAENIFKDYLYFSSYSELWLRHCRDYAAAMVKRYSLDASSLVVEIASNDGYLLQYFKESGIPVLGVEPAANVAKVAQDKGITSEVAFFGVHTARRLAAAGKSADLIAANNVLAHVPNINDFVGGFKILLKPSGTATFEFPHLLNLIKERQFDTIYHEHFSYLSLLAAHKIFSRHDLRIYDVEQVSTHGGSLRLFVCHAQADHQQSDRVDALLQVEADAGLDRLETYATFADSVINIKCDLLSFLIDARRKGKSVVGYGAPAKGNTLLNYCGIGLELLSYTVDISPHKQGRYLPGVQIPIHAPERIFKTKPDYVLILPWNIKDEITERMAGIQAWGGKFAIAIPRLAVLP
jgi:2-polyprenyl-3-methyl-5-hydroxy-6-metoxy-1,4-benzoquinol methylase